MELFYCEPENIYHDSMQLDSFETRHIVKTLRKNKGDKISVTDGKGNHYFCTITKINSVITCSIDEKKSLPVPKLKTILAVGFIKQNRLEFLMEKCTELGVNHFILYHSAYSNYFSDNLDRYKKITRQAIKQSMQFHLPDIELFENFDTFIDLYRNYPQKFVAYDSTFPALNTFKFGNKNLVCIGPEGGFNEQEKEMFKKTGFSLVSLGKNRLRSETAAICAAAILKL